MKYHIIKNGIEGEPFIYSPRENQTHTISCYPVCRHDINWISNSIPRWWGRQRVKVCLDCGNIVDFKTSKPV